MVLAMVICECCPPNEVDMMISALMNIFDTRASLVALLKTMIDREIAHTSKSIFSAETDRSRNFTGNEVDLFRGNSTCTRFLSAFARIHGYNYLSGLLIPLIKTMTSMPVGHAYDLDPAKAGWDNLEQNQRNVELIALSFLDIISSSVPTLPPYVMTRQSIHCLLTSLLGCSEKFALTLRKQCKWYGLLKEQKKADEVSVIMFGR